MSDSPSRTPTDPSIRPQDTEKRTDEDFTNSENEGFYCEENGEIHLRLDDKVEKTDINGIRTISADAAAVIETIQKDYSYLMK